MNIVKTIQQHLTTYTVYKFGNSSFRVAFNVPGEECHHVDRVFSSAREAEEYIGTCKNLDLCIALSRSGPDNRPALQGCNNNDKGYQNG